MSKMTKVLVTILIILILLLAGLAAVWFFTNNVIVDGTFYPKSAEFLNLSKKEITAEDYEKIQEALPGTQIYWNIPVDGRSYPVDEKEVTVKHLTDADMKGLSHMKNLKKLHAVGCTDYERLMQVAESLPADRLLLETDAPYMAPVPLRGKRCDSAMIAHTAARIAEIRGEDVDALLEQTRRNANTLFRLDL